MVASMQYNYHGLVSVLSHCSRLTAATNDAISRTASIRVGRHTSQVATLSCWCMHIGLCLPLSQSLAIVMGLEQNVIPIYFIAIIVCLRRRKRR